VNFTGQVRVPEIDHPGVPATILVEDDQAEVFLEGESLGRWSLFDVHATRLLSSAFSLSLAGEEITFIADEPVDFAYKGVDHMAEAWARYKSMTIPRRVVAVGRSRRNTLPSRINELREAMLQNLEAAGRDTPRLLPIERVRTEAMEASRSLEAPAVDAPSPVVRHEPDSEQVAAPPTRVFRPSPVDDVAGTGAEPIAPPATAPTRLRPGAGLFGRTARPETPVPLPEPGAHERSEQASPEPHSKSPWEEPVFAPDPGEEELVPEPAPVLEPEPPVARELVFQPEPVAHTEPEHSGEPDLTLPRLEPEPEAQPESQQIAPRIDDGADVFTPAPVPTDESAPVTTPPDAEVPELIKELLSTSTDEGGEEGARDLVVDLGQYEGRRGTGPTDEPPTPQTSKQPVLTGAPATSSERSGLLGAVRSAFARNKVPHEHEFVEAPGGIGIVRQICAECGYISIGLSD
jgi:hypothetical protein